MPSCTGTTVDLSEIDTDHLARQALKLFSKRYGRQYDTYMSVGTLYKSKGCITYEDYVTECKRLYLLPDDKAREVALVNWQHLTGGCSPDEYEYIDRQRCIDLCIKGYHSKDRAHVEKLKKVLRTVGSERYDMVDTDHDGFISSEELHTYAELHGIEADLKGVFASMDLNGDGVISREEFLQCYEGFHLYCDEERYNHVLGILEDK